MNIHSFHDWFITGMSVDIDEKSVVLTLQSDNKRDRATLTFSGAPRCVAEGFAAQNIVYELKSIEDFQTPSYKSALRALEKAHPWGSDWPLRKIIAISSSLGAEIIVEYDELDIEYSGAKPSESLAE
ncbi:hypothetical protein LMG24238_02513 [Paraburkholderia sediminicola]|uniref:Uncharacterized protein n=1 Tax=Paraburkholderia sediminicola TaxID=458836 RepID=A0A6J5AV25_9BURK|nr:hypothetical protein [Paraburkholderia sediminicola]CAB3679816.1 hypothetical protein LMG24238_02513 [Paraburkholderia sediminicola]